MIEGQNYFIRAAGAFAYTGKLLRIDRELHQLVLVEAAWVADTGRFAQWMAGETGAAEVEPYPDTMEVRVPIAHTEICQWPYPLPRAQQ